MFFRVQRREKEREKERVELCFIPQRDDKS